MLNPVQSGLQLSAFQNAVNTAFMQNPAAAMQALSSLNQIMASQAMMGMGAQASWQSFGGLAAQASPVPQPQIGLSGPPAGSGLSKDPTGWPKGSIQTAGGYTVVPNGRTNWSIFAPGQKPSDKPNTYIHGDPHVTEKDGTRWDFTKSSDFVLPDGTRIAAQTSSESGYSVTTGLTIANGADKVSVTGVNGSPKTGNITHDGFEWRAQHMAKHPSRDTFRLGGSGDKIHWFKESGGRDHGLITGAKYNGAKKRYEQVTAGDKSYWVAPEMSPAMGSAAWGNQFRSEVTDLVSSQMLPPQLSALFGQFIQANHSATAYEQQLLGSGLPMGGMLGIGFNSFSHAQDALAEMGDTLLNRHNLHLAMVAGQRGMLGA